MIELNVDHVRREALFAEALFAEALFASELQRSDALTHDEVSEAISRTVRRIGIAGCVSKMAQEFGDHPEAAAERMRWVRRLAEDCLAPRLAA
jgi:hypothetical protein